MDFKSIVFYVLAAILLFAALRVISARNPVHAVLNLILAFFTGAGIWLLLEAEFLAMVLVMVYIGAVMVLFLFVVMMLDIDLDRIREGFLKHLPVGILVGVVVLVEMGLVLSIGYFSGKTDASLPQAAAGALSNTHELGALLVTDYVYPFELTAVILLIAVIAAVALAYRGVKKATKHVDVADQVKVEAKDRMRLIKMPVEKAQTEE
jgi:NADH-quinone oxidoreductase subunit J